MTLTQKIDLATAIFKGDVFGSWNINPKHHYRVAQIFLPIAGMNQADKSELVFEKCSVYEFRNKSVSETPEGYPVFYTCEVIYPCDLTTVKRIVWMMRKANELTESIKRLFKRKDRFAVTIHHHKEGSRQCARLRSPSD